MKKQLKGGSLTYKVESGNRLQELNLTVCHEDDMKRRNLSDLRRKRILRILEEAREQGCLLSYKDLNLILLSSPATLKRDVNHLRRQGITVLIKNGKSPHKGQDNEIRQA